ncbi:undecaprenyl-phosphate glucose phosphotransferase [Dyella flagellata]|uniref:Undecaprenyl-phosphate glucose phosphotransferase n=1 Tax=Dyella flagellata TaxID=1867833 RepID=A0ABQ5XD90_9GAMM|nr:undecaprenyl-phosphate glucose phosphotransferase [Dyella flagellata]GLQ89452.1 undecaprenyl-phosphate glucose phosphotransferase [Dyella flagellata]
MSPDSHAIRANQARASKPLPSLHTSVRPGSIAFARPTALRNARLLTRLAHGLIAFLPCLLVLQVLHIHDAPLIHRYLAQSVLFGLLCVLVFQCLGMYGEDMFSNRWCIRKIFFAWCPAFGLLLIMHALFHYSAHIPVALFLCWFAGSYAGFIALRLGTLEVFRRLTHKGHFLQRSVILGCTENGIRLAHYLRQHSDLRAVVVGFIDDREPSRLPPEASQLLPRLGGMADLERLVREQHIDQVLVALPWYAEARNQHYAKMLRRLPVRVQLAPDMRVFRYAGSRITPIAGVPMFTMSELPLTGWSPLLKRAEDLFLGTLALLLLMPLMGLIALAIKLDSSGPVLFRQKRHGFNHQLIEVYKFRSMHHHLHDADATKQTGRNDARVTRVGRFIRKTSLDELPQLFNVLRGSMSLVGPRPHATATKAADMLFGDAVEEYASRHRVKPGMTGFAQVHGLRGETDTLEKIERRVEYDLAYIEHWSLWLDLYILVRTIPAVLLAREAY